MSSHFASSLSGCTANQPHCQSVITFFTRTTALTIPDAWYGSSAFIRYGKNCRMTCTMRKDESDGRVKEVNRQMKDNSIEYSLSFRQRRRKGAVQKQPLAGFELMTQCMKIKHWSVLMHLNVDLNKAESRPGHTLHVAGGVNNGHQHNKQIYL